MRFQYLASAITLLFACPAHAEVTASEACAFFSRGLPVVGIASNVDYEPIVEFEFEAVGTSLDRYATLVTAPIERSFGISGASGEWTLLGRVSARIVCVADVKDRRVLSLQLTDGPTVGDVIENWRGDKRKVQAPSAVEIDVGSQSHQGKY